MGNTDPPDSELKDMLGQILVRMNEGFDLICRSVDSRDAKMVSPGPPPDRSRVIDWDMRELHIENRAQRADIVDLRDRVAAQTDRIDALERQLDRIARTTRPGYRIAPTVRRDRIESFIVREVWSRIPPDQLGRAPNRDERERILGYGPDGV